eukprot:gnl/TRDRNA2_/TRDRNA2_30037_c0_seq2.p1 gnl/TRDRNA2_/TRDRNA2_30037_c0~~gnl/TRDRNA2_/TRDRNA2_30037_c0_seq2.p1  ORF type:complete len:212 (-),score=22.22 gnl/TRDRNA2_/TRDRNA2_30037_c0_seq2:69-704(-)
MSWPLAQFMLKHKHRDLLLTVLMLLFVGVSFRYAATAAGLPVPVASVIFGCVIVVVIMSLLFICVSAVEDGNRSREAKPPASVFVWQKLFFGQLLEENFSADFHVQRLDHVKEDDKIQHECNSYVIEEHVVPQIAKEGGSRVSENCTTCAICLSDFAPDDVVALLPCYHVYCEQCVIAWVSSGSSHSHKCPSCRSTFDLDSNHSWAEDLGV